MWAAASAAWSWASSARTAASRDSTSEIWLSSELISDESRPRLALRFCWRDCWAPSWELSWPRLAAPAWPAGRAPSATTPAHRMAARVRRATKGRRRVDIRTSFAGKTAAPTLPVTRSICCAVEMPSQRDAQILDRVRATPVGLRPHLRRRLARARRASPARSLHACEDPSIPWHRIVRADGSLAKGPRQRRLLEREGVPFNGERVDMRVARLPESLMWIQREITLDPRPRGFHLVTARGDARRCPSSGRSSVGSAPSPDPPHLGVADAQRERLARRAARLRDVVQPGGARARRRTGRTRSRDRTTCPPTSSPRCSARR